MPDPVSLDDLNKVISDPVLRSGGDDTPIVGNANISKTKAPDNKKPKVGNANNFVSQDEFDKVVNPPITPIGNPDLTQLPPQTDGNKILDFNAPFKTVVSQKPLEPVQNDQVQQIFKDYDKRQADIQNAPEDIGFKTARNNDAFQEHAPAPILKNKLDEILNTASLPIDQTVEGAKDIFNGDILKGLAKQVQGRLNLIATPFTVGSQLLPKPVNDAIGLPFQGIDMVMDAYLNGGVGNEYGGSLNPFTGGEIKQWNGVKYSNDPQTDTEIKNTMKLAVQLGLPMLGHEVFGMTKGESRNPYSLEELVKMKPEDLQRVLGGAYDEGMTLLKNQHEIPAPLENTPDVIKGKQVLGNDEITPKVDLQKVQETPLEQPQDVLGLNDQNNLGSKTKQFEQGEIPQETVSVQQLKSLRNEAIDNLIKSQKPLEDRGLQGAIDNPEEQTQGITPEMIENATKDLLVKKGLKLPDVSRETFDNGITLQSGIPGMESIQKFFEDDLKRVGQKSVEYIGDTKNEIADAFNPTNKDAFSKTTSRILRQGLGELEYKRVVATHILEQASKYFGENPENIKMMADYENGNHSALPKEVKNMFDVLNTMLTDRYDKIQKISGIDSFIENYLPHYYDEMFGKGVYGHSPLEGGKSFTKDRVFDTMLDAMKKDPEKYKPLTNNPVTLSLMKMHEMDKYLMAHDIWEQYGAKGLRKQIAYTDRIPEGWGEVNDKIARTFRKTPLGKMEAVREVMPTNAANILNNYLEPGLRGKALYEIPRLFGNLLNQIQLGMSGFHALFTTIDAVLSKQSLGLQKLFVKDQRLSAVKDLVQSYTVLPAVTMNLKRGFDLKKAYINGENTGLVQAVQRAGGRINMDSIYATDMWKNMTQAFKKGNPLGGLIRTPLALVDLFSKPIMEHLVPLQKMGVFSDMASSILKQEHDRLLTKDQATSRLQEAWNSVDNRLGQIVYDNLFWKKSVKDLGLIGVRSLGWNLGTFRELGGGVGDIRKLITEKRLTPRTAYTISLVTSVGLMGGLLTRLYTGQNPTSIKDYFAPRTGKMLPDGNPERIILPTYMKDIMGFGLNDVLNKDYGNIPSSMGTTLGHKMHPLISSVIEMLNNKDFYGYDISDKDPFTLGRLWDDTKFAGEQFLPFSVRNLKQRENATGLGDALTKSVQPENIGKTIQSFFGILPAPKYITNTGTQNQIYSLYDRRFNGSQPNIDKDKSTAKKQIRSLLDEGGETNRNEAERLYDIGVQQHYWKKDEMPEMEKGFDMPTDIKLFKRLGKFDQQTLLDKMQPDEQQTYAPYKSGLTEQDSMEGKILAKETKDLNMKINDIKNGDVKDQAEKTVRAYKLMLYKLQTGEMKPEELHQDIEKNFDFDKALKSAKTSIGSYMAKGKMDKVEEEKEYLRNLSQFNMKLITKMMYDSYLNMPLRPKIVPQYKLNVQNQKLNNLMNFIPTQ